MMISGGGTSIMISRAVTSQQPLVVVVTELGNFLGATSRTSIFASCERPEEAINNKEDPRSTREDRRQSIWRDPFKEEAYYQCLEFGHYQELSSSVKEYLRKQS